MRTTDSRSVRLTVTYSNSSYTIDAVDETEWPPQLAELVVASNSSSMMPPGSRRCSRADLG